MKCFQNRHGIVNFRAEDVFKKLYWIDEHTYMVGIPMFFLTRLLSLNFFRQFINLFFGGPLTTREDCTNFMWNATLEIAQMILSSQFVEGWCNQNFNISIMTRGRVFANPERMMQEHHAKWHNCPRGWPPWTLHIILSIITCVCPSKSL